MNTVKILNTYISQTSVKEVSKILNNNHSLKEQSVIQILLLEAQEMQGLMKS